MLDIKCIKYELKKMVKASSRKSGNVNKINKKKLKVKNLNLKYFEIKKVKEIRVSED